MFECDCDIPNGRYRVVIMDVLKVGNFIYFISEIEEPEEFKGKVIILTSMEAIRDG